MNTRDSRSYSALRCRESAIFSDSPYHECPYSLPCCVRGAGDGQESDARTNLQGAPHCDCCCRQRFLRVCSWRVPPRWSPRDWFAEMRSVGSAAGLLAIKDFDQAKGGSLSLFVGQRVLARSLTRYRQEWSYASRCVSEAFEDAYDGGRHWAERCETPEPAFSARMIDLLHNALSLLPESKRNLIRQLFFENESETEVARALGISQPAVNKRKWTILDNLRKRLAPEKIS